MKIKLKQLSETFVKELIKEPNIKEAFIREGIIENDKLEVGKWYKSTILPDVFIYLENEEKKRYGFDSSGWYKTNDSNKHIDSLVWTLATPQEVETALINEAKKRGYVKGVKFNAVSNNGDDRHLNCIFLDSFDYMHNLNVLSCNTTENTWKTNQSNPFIFKNGVWAEIIDETIEIKKSLILNTPNDLELGQLIRKMV